MASSSAQSQDIEDGDEPDSAELMRAPVPVVIPGPWRDAVRDEQWADAAVKLDALAENEKSKPPLRFVRARVASALGDFATTLRWLTGLEPELPVLQRRIALLRAEAQSVVGPYEEAAAYWKAQPGAKALLRAAQSYDKANLAEEARKALDRLVVTSGDKSLLTEAHGLRARIAEAQGLKELAVADARWIVAEAPLSPFDRSAREQLARLDPSFSLSAKEHLARALRFADASRSESALGELEAAAAQPLGTSQGDFLHAKGQVLFKLKKWAEATLTLREATHHASPDPIQDEFLAARALSRADHDAEAIAAYRSLAKRNPKSAWADDAIFLAARLSWLLGKEEDAEALYGEYLRKFAGGKNQRDAAYEIALVQRGRKRWDKARSGFAKLATEAESALEAARLRELEGVVAFEQGNTNEAEQIFRAVMRAQPLSWPALVARSRLVALGVTPPPHLEAGADVPSEAASAFNATLPASAELLRSLGLLTDAEDALRKDEKMFQAAQAPRGTEASCNAYGTLERASRRHRVAQDQIRADTLLKAPTAAQRWAWDCFFPAPYPNLVRLAEQREAIATGLVYAIMRQESSFQPAVVSPARAVGLLQLLPETARKTAQEAGLSFEENSLSRPPVNIDLGARYLSKLLRLWKSEPVLAVASYNAGPKAVAKWVQRSGKVPIDIWAAQIPYGETRTYVTRVMGNFAHYAYLSGGEAAVPVLGLSLEGELRVEGELF